MTFLAPGFFLASLVVAAAVVALHFIVTRQPRAGVLPTARFVPDLPATATARATRPSDLLLMLLRVLLVLAAGAALARPILKPSRSADARVILLDVSRSSQNVAGLRDSAARIYKDGDVMLAFDSAARVIPGSVRDSLQTVKASAKRGNLSGALIAALRAGSELRDRADSVELVILSSFSADEVDAATDSIRRMWPGSARLVKVDVPVDSTAREADLSIRGAAGDPLQVSVGLARKSGSSGAVLVRDGTYSGEVDAGVPVVEWPAVARPRATVARSVRDTIGGVVAGDDVVIAGFERRWKFLPDSLRGGEVIARWIDGEPAAVEWPTNSGCLRSVAVPVSPAGDLVIRSEFVRFVQAMTGRCAGRKSNPMSTQAMASLTGTGGKVSRDAFKPRGDIHSTLAPWLFAIAIAAAIAELFVRRRTTPDAPSRRPMPGVAEAAR
jgi:hypothetical protein